MRCSSLFTVFGRRDGAGIGGGEEQLVRSRIDAPIVRAVRCVGTVSGDDLRCPVPRPLSSNRPPV